VKSELKAVASYFREHGCRWTDPRRAIVETAFATHRHFTADELLEMARRRDASVSRATVYRTLALLEKGGFVEGLDVGDGGRRFEHTLGHPHHDHMVCLKCGRILEFQDEEIERRQKLAAAAHGFTIASHSLRLYGTCRSCGESGRGSTTHTTGAATRS
jgi:Fur family ferric uptake transcriptional regulator